MALNLALKKDRRERILGLRERLLKKPAFLMVLQYFHFYWV